MESVASKRAPLRAVREENCQKSGQHPRELFPFGAENSHKVLGLQWDSKSDIFYYTLDLKSKSATKRNILSVIARMFDPLGLISPVILTAKILIKRLRQEKIDWDEEPPNDTKNIWEIFLKDLALLPTLKIPRYVFIISDIPVDIIGFCDGSYTGYGAAVCIRSALEEVHCNLYFSRGKITSIKSIYPEN